MKKIFSKMFCLLFAFIMLFCFKTMAQSALGYIANIDDSKIYLKLQSPDIRPSDVLYVMTKEKTIIDHVSGQEMRLEPEQVGQIKIISVNADYAVAKALGNFPLEAGMTVQRGSALAKNGYGDVSVIIAPAETEFPEGANNLVYNTNSGTAYLGDYVSATLMEHLLKSNKIQMLDRSTLKSRTQEKALNDSGQIDFNTAMDFARLVQARYIVKVIMLKPDIESISNKTPLKGFLTAAAQSFAPNTNTQQQLGQLVPDNVGSTKVKASVNLKVEVIDLQTSAVLFMSSSTGNATGKPQIDMEISAVGNAQVNQSVNNTLPFNQTVTGRAIEHAFEKIGNDLNRYFNNQLNN